MMLEAQDDLETQNENMTEDGLVFTCDHEGGSLDRAVRCGQNYYSLILRPDSWYYFNFHLTGCKDKELIFQFLTREIGMRPPKEYIEGGLRWRLYDSPPIKPVYSYDGKTWHKVDKMRKSGGIQGSYIFSHYFTENEVYIGYSATYLYSDLQAYLAEIRDNPLVDISSLGKTRCEVDMPMVTVGRNPKGKETILIIAREDADEIVGSYAAEGMINFLLTGDPDAEWLLDNYVFRIVPMVSIDGVIAGCVHSAGYGYSGAHWNDPVSPRELENVKDLLRELKASGQKIAFAAQLHSGQTMDRYPGDGHDIDFYTHNIKLYKTLLTQATEYWDPSPNACSVKMSALGFFNRYLIDNYNVNDCFCTHVQGETPDVGRLCGRDLLRAIIYYLRQG